MTPAARSGKETEPRWLAALALLALGGLYGALPADLAPGPRWIMFAIVIALLVPTVVSHRVGRHSLNQVCGFLVNGVVTLSMVVSIALLLRALPRHAIDPQTLLRSASVLWVTNILVFALWYWRLDAGGPHARELRDNHTEGAFLFPQMQIQSHTEEGPLVANWSPNFVDYLFLSFNTSTALSPADTQALSRWAKVLMMLQSTISLAVVVLLAARAVNIL